MHVGYARAFVFVSVTAAVFGTAQVAVADSADLAAWTSFLGWSFHPTIGTDQTEPTMRMRGKEGPLAFSLLRRGDDYAYTLLDQSGERLLRISHIHGTSIVYDHAGTVNAHADAFAADLNGIVEVLTNDLATRPAHKARDGHAIVIDVGMQRTATLALDSNGMCVSATIDGGKTRTMIPERVSDLPGNRRFYTGWRINGEPWIIEDVLPNHPISDDELGAL